MAPQGTAFEHQVWGALAQIKPGATKTYGDLARALGQPNAARAVGAANGRNPISVLIPCHRLLGANGALTGYAGGLAAKRWLLHHEAALHPGDAARG
jgi:methylated-DNA-[protein]-cysteine S-methyltransferase